MSGAVTTKRSIALDIEGTSFSNLHGKSVTLPDSVSALDILTKRHGRDGVQAIDLRPVDESDWLRVDQNLARELALKERILDQHRRLVHTLLPEGYAGASELLRTIAKWLTTHHPTLFELQRDQIFNIVTGERIPLDSEHPLLATSKLIQEDLVLLHRRNDGEYRLCGGLLCFPSNWRLNDKLGLSIRETHEPVTLVNDNIGEEIDRLLDRLRPSRIVGRVNLLVRVDSELSLIPDLHSPTDWPAPEPERFRQTLFIRNERQTLLKLPDSEDIVFGIKIYVTPLRELSREVSLHSKAILQEMPEQFLSNYKGWDRKRTEAVLAALDLQAEQYCTPSS